MKPGSEVSRPSRLASALRDLVQEAGAKLESLAKADVRAAPAPGKWSPAQVIGHLLDSAIINHQRFLRAALYGRMCFEGYDQDRWVQLQQVEGMPWADLLEAWRGINLVLARAVSGLPDEVLQRGVAEHNLHEIAWEVPPPGKPATLAFFIRDYMNHMRHHLRQIDPALAAPPFPQLGGSAFKSR